MKIRINKKDGTIIIRQGRTVAVYSGGWCDKPQEAIEDFKQAHGRRRKIAGSIKVVAGVAVWCGIWCGATVIFLLNI